MTESPPRAPSLARRALAVAVGLFAAWQLVYLPAANLIDLVPRRTGPPLEPIDDSHQVRGTFTSVEPLQRAAEITGDALDFWSEVSGQEQGWSLFAPGMPPYTVVPAAEFHFADGTSDTLLSPYEPTDKRRPRLRPPLVDNRPFNNEAMLTYPVWFIPPVEIAEAFAPPEDVARLPEAYRTLPEAARAWRGLVRAWLAWRLKEYRAAHPERGAPVAVVLKHRYIPTPAPNQPPDWTAPVVERPYAKWRPGDDGYEVYDAVNRRFVPVEEMP
jgi:hypothetical protein